MSAIDYARRFARWARERRARHQYHCHLCPATDNLTEYDGQFYCPWHLSIVSRPGLRALPAVSAPIVCVVCGQPARNVYYCADCHAPVCLVCVEGHECESTP